MSSDDESREIVNDDEIEEIERCLNEFDRVNVEKLKSIRENLHWEENESGDLVGQIQPLLIEWLGAYPNLREIFRPKEIDLLLKDSIKCRQKRTGVDDNAGDVFLEFLINTGYKDEPEVDGEVDDDGKPLLRRTTPVHLAAYEEDGYGLQELFKIYDRFDLNFVNQSGYTHFHAACEFGFDDVVKKFLELGEDPNLLVPKTGDSPLHMTVTNQNATMARLLLDSGANPNLANLNGWTPLHYICKINEYQSHEDDDYAEVFLTINDDIQKTVQIDAQDKSGNTPLHLALDYGLERTSEILLRRGADVNLVNAEGLTPLHMICKRDDNSELLEMFFNINEEKNQVVQVDARDKKGRTPLQYAVANFGPHMVEFLFDHGADLSGFVFPSESDFDEEYDLQSYSCGSSIKLRLASGALACVERLEKRGYELDRGDALTIMNVLVKKQVFKMPLNLEEHWYDVERFATQAKGKTINSSLTLYEFIRSPPEGATKLLTYMEYFDFARISCIIRNYPIEPFDASIAHLCEMSSRRFFRRWALDPLMELTYYRLPIFCCEMIIKQLMNEDLREWHGPYPNLREIFRPKEIDLLLKHSMIYFNFEMENDSVFEFLEFVVKTGYKDKPELYHTGASRGLRDGTLLCARAIQNLRQVRRELHRRSRLHTFPRSLRVRLQRCRSTIPRARRGSQSSRAKNRRYATTHGCDQSSRDGGTIVAGKRRNPNLANLNGWTPLHYICKMNYQLGHEDNDYAELFLKINDDIQKTVQIDAQDKSGNTPLHIALDYGLSSDSEILLRRGADPNIVNAEGLTPLHMICKRDDNSELLEMFFNINEEKNQVVQIDARDKSGNTPLHVALEYSLKVTAEILLRRGVDPNITNAEGLTPLHVICKRDYNDDLMEMFFNINGEKNQIVQIDARDKKGRTPLQYAVANFGPHMVEFLFDHGADLSGFDFPSESDFDEKYHLRIDNYDSIIKLRLASGALACVERLEKRGYELDRSDALTIMNVLVNEYIFEKPMNLDESWYDDERFARETKEIEIRPGLSFYDFIRSPPEEATKLLTYMEYFDFAPIIISLYYRNQLLEASIAHLCEMSSRRFFRRWALDPLMEVTHYRLPILCCEMINMNLMNEDLWRVCWAAKLMNEDFRSVCLPPQTQATDKLRDVDNIFAVFKFLMLLIVAYFLLYCNK
ncbi:unnamed protein product [Trichogramma brassicae]|uniref:Uncharacterized protein n=1 Tax=Trichogramma brassicae TaxID=86971 RepID=A0A6H5ISF5_9HYME|nr:unnamed protein product [Trichogramma brassicae]